MFKLIVDDYWIKAGFASMLYFFLIGCFAVGLVRNVSWWLTGVSAVLILVKVIIIIVTQKRYSYYNPPWLILFWLIVSGYLLLILDIIEG